MGGYIAVVVSASDYEPFGLVLEGRSLQGGGYRWGFNGKEDDGDFGGGQLIQDYGFRLYNPTIGKFLSVDPLFRSYPWYTPYQFAGNTPIWKIDLDGLEEADSEANKEKNTTYMSPAGKPITLPSGSSPSFARDNVYNIPSGALTSFTLPNGDYYRADYSSVNGTVYFNGYRQFLTKQGAGNGSIYEEALTQEKVANGDGIKLGTTAIALPLTLGTTESAIGAARLNTLLTPVALMFLVGGDTRARDNTGDGVIATPADANDPKTSLLGLGYWIEIGTPGHSFVGISPTINPEQMLWYHQSGGLGTMAKFEELPADIVAEELDGSGLSLKSGVTYKQITKTQYMSAFAAIGILTTSPAQPYNIRTHNCATATAHILNAAGYSPPNMTSKHPVALFNWFQAQP